MRACLPLAAVCAVTAAAQQGASPEAEGMPEFSADRPGYATSTVVLSRGLAQFEGGFTLEIASGPARERTVVLGNPLARIGIGRRMEIRVGGDGVRWLSSGASATAGRSDTLVGVKIALARERRRRPAIAVLPAVSFPTGHRAFSSAAYDPSIGVAWSKTLLWDLSAGGTVAWNARSEDRARHLQQSAAVSLGRPLGGGLTGFVEVYGICPGGGSRSTNVADGGLSRPIGGSLQIDFYAGRTLSPGAPGWFAAAGFAVRRSAH